MMFSEGVDAVALAGEVVLSAYMLQTAMRAVITAVAAIMAILRIVLSLQEVVHPLVLPDLHQRATQHRPVL
jgi:hypothetical protein